MPPQLTEVQKLLKMVEDERHKKERLSLKFTAFTPL